MLRRTADEVQAELDGIDGLVDLHTELQEDVPHIEVTTRLEAAGRHGLTPGDVRRAAAALVQGIEVNDIWRPTRVFDVNIWSRPEARTSLTSIRNLPVDTPNGGHVALADVADVRVAPTPNVIRRENVTRRIDVSADVSGRDFGSVVDDVERRLAGVELPRGYAVEVLGESAEREAAQSRLRLYGLAAAIGVFALLQVAFGSWRLAALFFVTLPLALVAARSRRSRPAERFRSARSSAS